MKKIFIVLCMVLSLVACSDEKSDKPVIKIGVIMSFSGAEFGNKNIRAGCLIPVILNVRDGKVSHYMLVEKVTHKFSNKQWTMDLVLSGGGFDVEL